MYLQEMQKENIDNAKPEIHGKISKQVVELDAVTAIKVTFVMDDGSEDTFSKGDIMMLPPGHDAWTVGDEPCEFIQFTQGDNYYTDHAKH